MGGFSFHGPITKINCMTQFLLTSQIEYYTGWENVKNAFLYFKDPEDNDHQNIRRRPVTREEGLLCNAEWMSISFPIIERFRRGFEAGENPFLDLDALFLIPIGKRDCCRNGSIRWRQCVEGATKGRPKFSQDVLGRSEK